MAIIDVITFNGEYDLFDIRYNILKDYVDEFIVIEFDKTFSGKDKPFWFRQIIDNYPKAKVKYFAIVNNAWHKYMGLSKSSPNTIGAEHWKEEFCQKEYIKDCLTHLQDDDIVFIGDCDEIYDYHMIEDNDLRLNELEFNGYTYANGTAKIKLNVYCYYLNNRSSEEFYGTLLGKYKHIKDECLNHLRSNPHATKGGNGWHFTSMGGHEEIKRKLSDSYTRESYWTEQVENNLKDNVENSKDFLGRGFTYKIDESELPQYLKDNKEKYAHLFK